MVSYRKFRRDWCAIAAVVGLAILAVAGLIAWGLNPKEPSLSGDPAYQEESPNYYPGGSECYPSNIMGLAGSERLERSSACEQAREQHRLDTNDLIQQRRSADAADAMAVLSYEQARIAAWSAVFGFLTLCAAVAAALYAGMAAIAARRAVVHAKSAANAGWHTVTQAKAATAAATENIAVAKEVADRQTRPYIIYTGADVMQRHEIEVDEYIHFIFKIHLFNAGATSAVIRRQRCVLNTENRGTQATDGNITKVVPAQGEYTIDFPTSLSLTDIRLKQKHFLAIKIRYEGASSFFERWPDEVIWLHLRNYSPKVGDFNAMRFIKIDPPESIAPPEFIDIKKYEETYT